MIKHIIFCFLFTAVTANVFSQQRNADIKATMSEPANGSTINVNDQFPITTTFYNLGPDTIRTTDTLMYQLIFDGSPIFFGNATGGMDSFLTLYGKEIVPGDSADFGMGFSIDTNWVAGPHTFCTALFAYNKPGNVYDTIMANNKSCVNVIIHNTTSVNIASLHRETVSVYPNPAKDYACITLCMAKDGMVSYRIADMSGKVLIQHHEGNLQQGEHCLIVNTTALSAGTYLYRVIAGEAIYNGRIKVQ